MKMNTTQARRTAGSGSQDTYEPGLVEVLISQLGKIQDGLRTLNGAQALGAIPRQITNGQSNPISTSPGRIAGWSVRETAAATALIRLRDGTSATGDPIATIALTANQSVRDWFMPTGISFSNGLYVEVVFGAIEGVVYLGPLP